MHSPVKSAPLTLLIGDTASNVETGLRNLLASHDEFSIIRGGLAHKAAFEILYRGVSLILSVNAQVGELSALKQIFCNLDVATVGCGLEIGLGDHVAGGERVPAIVQALLGAAENLGSSLDAVATIWQPADIVSGFEYFSGAVTDYLAGGSFPVLALVSFKAGPDGAIDSKGLAFLSGQELHVLPASMDQADLMRRVVRVVHDIAVNGPMSEPARLSGIEPGEILELKPLPGSAVLKMHAYLEPRV